MDKDVKIQIKFDTTELQRGLLTILRGLYQINGSPLGKTEEGFQAWLIKEGIKKPDVGAMTDIWE